jgi:hypothetical protein
MGGDDDGFPHAVEFAQQVQQAQGHVPIHIAGGFIGKDHIGVHDDGTRQGRALAFATRQFGRAGVGAARQTHPCDQFLEVAVLVSAVAARHDKGQGDVFADRQMVKKFAILMHHADALTGSRNGVTVEPIGILPEQGDRSSGGQKLGVAQLEQGGLACTRGAGQKVKRPRCQPQGHVRQDRRGPVAIGGILHLDHESPLLAPVAVLSCNGCAAVAIGRASDTLGMNGGRC